ncbi:AAA family ATPase [Tolypothrix sp. VBCCA 56010]|uniref:AAA family ATPase n=1 Tax=Tolypothrix sp. VBCCA 56010 TaxID=3137731 RepID=UPI003D7D1E39
MYISKFQIINYKSFYSSEILTLTPGFNVIVGQNHVGKTSLVEALSLQFNNHPHRSLKTLPESFSFLQNEYSQCRVYFELELREKKDLLRNINDFYVPLQNDEGPSEAFKRFIEKWETNESLKCIFKSQNNYSMHIENDFEAYPHQMTRIKRNTALDEFSVTGEVRDYSEPHSYSSTLGINLINKIYIFKAERLNLGQCSTGANRNLASNAANLAEVLNLLQSSNPLRFKRFNELVSFIFPQITQITVPPVDNNTVKIFVWTIDPVKERNDLAVPLSESGTGIGQVLAILYVILTSDEPRTIIIDEPQSFLHPGAVRKLMEILKRHSRHQFIITTHSPTVVTATNPQTLFLIRNEESESLIEPINVSETNEIRRFLLEIGARLSDVFGADNILWVEGRTEELCFPLIVEKVLETPLMDIQIIGVQHTGDFESKRSKTIFEIYERLSKGKGLLPPAIGFIFDKESRTETEMADLIRLSKGKIKFLKRTMYENYLLNPQAISTVISQVDLTDSLEIKAITPEVVEQWIKDNGCRKKYIDEKISATPNQQKWLEHVHGAKLLEDIFSNLSDNRVCFDKVKHGVLLTDWIIKNAPSELSEVSELIQKLFNS